jgi:hypothetical protein
MRNSDIQIDLNVEVRDDLIIVTPQPTTTFHAINLCEAQGRALDKSRRRPDWNT